MHITTHHIPARRRHIDAAIRLRRLSHVVAVSTRVVRGCKFPRRPSARFSPHAELRRPRILRVGGRLVMSLSFVFRKSLRSSRKGQKVF